jgi:hypothetical protein
MISLRNGESQKNGKEESNQKSSFQEGCKEGCTQAGWHFGYWPTAQVEPQGDTAGSIDAAQ